MQPGAADLLKTARQLRRDQKPAEALTAYFGAIDAAPTLTNYVNVAEAIDDLLPAGRALRIALLGNATLDYLQSYVKVECARLGLVPAIYQAGFDQYNQEILDPTSGLYAFAP